MNLQRVAKPGFEMYLAKYISNPESSFNVKLSMSQCNAIIYLLAIAYSVFHILGYIIITVMI